MGQLGQLALHGGRPAVTRAPKAVPSLNPDDLKAAVGRLIDHGVYSDVSPDGPVAAFERAFADVVHAPYGLSFASGTTALLCAYMAVGVGAGDEVVHPCYSWISAIAPVLQLGASPVFCDVDPRTLLADPAAIEARITPRTKAISVVHMHGNVCDMDSIGAIARRHGLALIEDCSHSHGASWRDRSCGTLGDIGCFSLQGSPIDGKAVAAGEGGIAVTGSRDLYERMLLLGHINRRPTGNGFSRDHWNRLAPLNAGMKYRMHPWAAACASLTLPRLSDSNAKKREIRNMVGRALQSRDAVRLVDTTPGSVAAGFYGGLNLVYRPDAAYGVSVGEIRAALRAEGCAVGGAPCPLLHLLPLFTEGDGLRAFSLSRDGAQPARFAVAETIHAHVLNILHPMNLEPDDPYIAQLLDGFAKVFDHIGRNRSLRPLGAAIPISMEA